MEQHGLRIYVRIRLIEWPNAINVVLYPLDEWSSEFISRRVDYIRTNRWSDVALSRSPVVYFSPLFPFHKMPRLVSEHLDVYGVTSTVPTIGIASTIIRTCTILRTSVEASITGVTRICTTGIHRKWECPCTTTCGTTSIRMPAAITSVITSDSTYFKSSSVVRPLLGQMVSAVCHQIT